MVEGEPRVLLSIVSRNVMILGRVAVMLDDQSVTQFLQL